VTARQSEYSKAVALTLANRHFSVFPEFHPAFCTRALMTRAEEQEWLRNMPQQVFMASQTAAIPFI